MWYQTGRAIDPELPDVFYLVSTDVIRAHDDDGSIVYRSTLTDEDRKEIATEMDKVSATFGDSFNFLSPYYHQFTMDALSLPAEQFKKEFEDVADEACEAFDYYMADINGGRPFVLAGFSQGAMLAIEVLKHMSDTQYSKMVAAYVMGYRLAEEDIAAPHIVPADDAYGWGETVSFSSVMTTDAIWPMLSEGAATCINPLNWQTDTTSAPLHFRGDEATVSIDPEYNVLIVKGLDKEKYHFPMLDGFCAPGNLHHWDRSFYLESIRDNALHRVMERPTSGVQEGTN